MKGLYALLLYLYPRSFREEYGDEVQAVFTLSLADAANSGKMEIAKVMLRELISLQQGIFFEHLRERRKNRKFGSPFSEMLAVFIPFIVVLVLSFPIGAIPDIPVRVVEIFRLSLIGILLTMFVVGFTRGLPATVKIPAPRAARTPATESSKARQSPAVTPSLSTVVR